MVRGISKFRQYFSNYKDQYVLIGGSACALSFQNQNLDFRSTKDLDIVLMVETQTKDFFETLETFINEGQYRNKCRYDGTPQFYRFDKPQNSEFPAMVELFSKADFSHQGIKRIQTDASVMSLSAILLDEDYYDLLLREKTILNEISVLKPSGIIAFKAKAWLDLTEKMNQGSHVDSRDIKKHKNDVIRILTFLRIDSCEVSDNIRKDMRCFLERAGFSKQDVINCGIQGIDERNLIETFKKIYSL